MRIRNESQTPVVYSLRGGPLRMTLSTCELSPGEEELWHARYHVHLGLMELIVSWADDDEVRVELPAEATVVVEDAPAGAVRVRWE